MLKAGLSTFSAHLAGFGAHTGECSCWYTKRSGTKEFKRLQKCMWTVKWPVGQSIKIRSKHSKTYSWLALSTWAGKLIHWHLAVLLGARSNIILISAPILCKGVQTYKNYCSRDCIILPRRQQHRNWAESVEVSHLYCRNINVTSAAAAAAAVARD